MNDIESKRQDGFPNACPAVIPIRDGNHCLHSLDATGLGNAKKMRSVQGDHHLTLIPKQHSRLIFILPEAYYTGSISRLTRIWREWHSISRELPWCIDDISPRIKHWIMRVFGKSKITNSSKSGNPGCVCEIRC
ncbi:uncharacterized protein LOC129747543 [Uranotaenia lowii]|uniref:uncharacterized protein LOC129747543 n=1 Tax=Uranotaenia lowii TaxID=190385 RepID=UPI00247A3EF6|nr:uncharacterized protein LOC129747543 [Uranotaenia lowii]